MQLNPAAIAPQVLKPQPPITPAVQATFSPAVAAAQQTTVQTRTQTINAPQAAGKADNPRDTQSKMGTERGPDTLAESVNARTNGAGYGRQQRGMRLDVSV